MRKVLLAARMSIASSLVGSASRIPGGMASDLKRCHGDTNFYNTILMVQMTTLCQFDNMETSYQTFIGKVQSHAPWILYDITQDVAIFNYS